jgi:DNA-directed RNA polymerase subunit RPC12/RpoP
MTSNVPAFAASPFDCAACGAHGTWHPGRQAVVCPACGTAIETPGDLPSAPEAFEFLHLLRDRPDSGRDWQPGATRVRCDTCGTQMDYPEYLAGRNCEGCGSPALIPCDETGAPVRPSGIVPFLLTEAEARERAAAWLETQRPTGSRRRFAIDTMRALYVPGWTFSARVRVPWRAERLRTDRDGQTERESISGVAQVAIDDDFVPATASMPADLLAKVDPFAAADLVAYHPRYLAGYEVEVYAVNLWDAWDASDAQMQRRVDRSVRAAAGRDASGLETWPEWSGQRCRHVLVPVYAVTYTYAGRQYDALVDGRAGRVRGRTPNDPLGCLISGVVLLGLLGGLILLVILAVRWLF